MSSPASYVLALPLLIMAACADGDANAGFIERDSAGIRIVENDHTQPAWSEESAWRLSPEPVVSIGGVSGDSAQLLYRVIHARRLSDGTIAVVNGGSRQVRFYDANANYEGAIGGDGDGPGEFRSPWALHELPGDSLLIIDLYREISIFGPDRQYVRRFAPQRPEGTSAYEGFEPVGQFGDGTLLFRSHFPFDQNMQGLWRTRIRMVRTKSDGSMAAVLGPFFDQTVLTGRDVQHIFGPWAKEAPSDSTMWYGPGDRFELVEIGFDGDTLTIVRLDRPPRPVTPEDVATFVQGVVYRYTGTPREEAVRRMFSEPEHPDHFPAHFEVMADAERNLWVQDYQPFQLRIERMWTVFDARGRYLGDVTMPAGFTPFEIGADYVLGRWMDDLDVEYVHVYSLEKP